MIFIYFYQDVHRDVKIQGFINIDHRQSVRLTRMYNRQVFWEDILEYRDDHLNWVFFDIFDLHYLFGLRPYEVDEPEQMWD